MTANSELTICQLLLYTAGLSEPGLGICPCFRMPFWHVNPSILNPAGVAKLLLSPGHRAWCYVAYKDATLRRLSRLHPDPGANLTSQVEQPSHFTSLCFSFPICKMGKINGLLLPSWAWQCQFQSSRWRTLVATESSLVAESFCVGGTCRSPRFVAPVVLGLCDVQRGALGESGGGGMAGAQAGCGQC